MKDLFRSKKVLTAVIALILAILGHFGVNIDNETLMTLLSPLLALIVGQGIADVGKERAKIEQKGQ